MGGDRAGSRSSRPCGGRDPQVLCRDPRTGQLLREHLRAPRGWHRIEDRDRPARTPPKTFALLAAAKRAGPAISTICDHIHRHDGAAGVRRILGVLSLARKHGPAVAEEAANAALELGVPTYRFLRLDRRPAAPLSLRQVDPLIRQLTLYRDLIEPARARSRVGSRQRKFIFRFGRVPVADVSLQDRESHQPGSSSGRFRAQLL